MSEFDESQPLAVAKAEPLPVAQTEQANDKPKTPQEMRVLEVSEALLPAYQKAGTLELTEEECTALMRDFSDSSVEIRPNDGLIYLPHILISDRLNRVFSPGKWALIRRREWFDGDTSTMYGEYVLVIRGCYVGESVGGHPYNKNNPKQNYSDALESTAAEALRRIAGKRLSCGSQVWHPDYARNWIEKYAETYEGTNYKGQRVTLWRVKKNAFAVQGSKLVQAKTTPKAPDLKVAPAITDKERETLKATLAKFVGPMAKEVGEYLKTVQSKDGSVWLAPFESLEDLRDDRLKILVEKWDAIYPKVEQWMREHEGEQRNPAPEPPPEIMDDVPAEPEQPGELPLGDDADEWKSFPMPFGKNKGVPLGELDKKYLFGLWANYVVETEYNGKAKKAETIEQDELFRSMLDMAGEHYKFSKKD